MPVSGFNHYNIRVADLDRTRRFYSEVLGLTPGDRPPFSRPGVWMYIGEQPVLHVSPEDKSDARGIMAFDHVAFSASGLDETRAKLKGNGIYFEEYAVPDRALFQVFFRDPDGVAIELQFSGPEAQAACATGAAVDSSRGRGI